jgi:hypothetical protein
MADHPDKAVPDIYPSAAGLFPGFSEIKICD